MLSKNYWYSSRVKIGFFYIFICLLNIYFMLGFVLIYIEMWKKYGYGVLKIVYKVRW